MPKQFDILIRNAKLRREESPIDIGISNGKISAIDEHLPGEAAVTIDADGSLVAAPTAPFMEPYGRHVLICTGQYCSPAREGRILYALLARLLEREGLLFGSRRVKRGETACLGVCAGGPIVVVYPEGVWYACVTPALLEQIVVQHLKGGHVVEDAVFHRLAVLPAP